MLWGSKLPMRVLNADDISDACVFQCVHITGVLNIGTGKVSILRA
jgi:hypothetical protein